MKRLVAYGAIICMLLAGAGKAFGQAAATATIQGTVSDPSGAVIVGATITITDTMTKANYTAKTNNAGLYVFTNVLPGTYAVRAVQTGFRVAQVPSQTVTIGQVITLDLRLQVGTTAQVVEVTSMPGAELQTSNATMGGTLGGTTLINLPSMSRDVNMMINLQATSAPTFHGAENDITSGSVGGATPEQNTFMLDGGNNTSGLEGDNGYINGFMGDQRGIVPTPMETIQEFKVATNNQTADFNMSAGAQIQAVTKRGSDQWHGSAYDYFQGQWLNSSDFDVNVHGNPKKFVNGEPCLPPLSGCSKVKAHMNRFGFSGGGRALPGQTLGGKTYFYYDYEGERFPRSGPFTRTVPSDTLRRGILQIKTAEGMQAFDLSPANVGSLTVCGPSGGLPCDPRNIGMSSVVTQLWNTYMPEPNDFTGGDKVNGNTFLFRGNLTFPLKNNFMVGRIDHDFSDKWRFMGTYRWYKDYSPVTNEVDIGGLLPGDKKGVPAPASRNITQPRFLVLGLTGTLTPTLTNQFHFTYTRNQWAWLRNGVVPQIPGVPGTLEIGGESTQALIPINVDTQNARRRAWYEHNWDYRDELSWLKGAHLFQFGTDIMHEWWHFNRYDNVVGGLTFLVYAMEQGALKWDPIWEPQPCGGGVTSLCIDPGDAEQLSAWKGNYGNLLGFVNFASIVATRTGADLHLNPLGTPAASYVTVNTPDFYFSDVWHVKPNLTINYGLNWGVQMPPHDLNGAQMNLVDPSNNPITYQSWIANRVAAAQRGQVYLPTIGFSPIGAIGGGQKYPFNPYYGEFAPRVSVAFSPNWDSGWLGSAFGHKTTVLRGGFGRYFARDFGINVVSNPVLGDGFLEPVSCKGPGIDGLCHGQSGVDPATSFRLGSNADGLVAPLPALTPTLTPPVQPGITAPYAILTDSMDRNFRPASYDRIDFSVQRQLGRNQTLEVGYLGMWARNLFQGIDLNATPFMMKLGGQTFAQAYLSVYQQLNGGVAPGAVSAQPFFESALSGTGYCAGFGSCTAAVATNEGPNFLFQNVSNLWSDLDTSWNFGPGFLSTNQGFWTYGDTSLGLANYQALVVNWTRRSANGLMLMSNFTYGHALGTIGLAQTYTLDTPDDVYNLHNNWTPQPWDRKFVWNFLGTYELPFGPGHRWANSNNGVVKRLAGGWQLSPVFTWASGLPNENFSGSFQEMGAGFTENGASAVPVGINTRNLSNSFTKNFTVSESSTDNPSCVACNGNADNGGYGVNTYGNKAISVFNSFRPFLLGLDGAPSGDGNLRKAIRWNLDLGLTKDTQITERVHLQIFGQAFNVLNHMQWGDPFLDIQDPFDFGVSGGQYGALALGGAGASPNYTRVIQLGARISF